MIVIATYVGGIAEVHNAHPKREVSRIRGGDSVETMRTPYCSRRRERGERDSLFFFTCETKLSSRNTTAQDRASA